VAGDKIQIFHKKRKFVFELPQTFQFHQYLNHPEEMAGWLRAMLKEENICIRNFKFVLDSSQVYFQTISLPEMSAENRKNWVVWESSRHVPYEPGTYQAVLVPWHSGKEGKNSNLSWQESGQSGANEFLLVAVLNEKVSAIRQCAASLKANLTEVTAEGPGKRWLPVSLLPEIDWKKEGISWGCKIISALCLMISVLIMIRSTMQWQQTKNAFQAAERKLAPLSDFRAEFTANKELEHRILVYRNIFHKTAGNCITWYPLLRTLSDAIPEQCWIEMIREKQNASPLIEIQGCSRNLMQTEEFVENLNHSGVLTRARIAECSEKADFRNNKGENENSVMAFILLAEPRPGKKEGMP